VTPDPFAVVKVDDRLGIVFGFAAVTTVDGEPYMDTQGNTIAPDALVKAAADYMQGPRDVGEQHQSLGRGKVVFCFPLVPDIAKALHIETPVTGLLIGMKPDDALLAKYRSGELRSFSIGGRHEIVDGQPVVA
jgi:hypothetical protein